MSFEPLFGYSPNPTGTAAFVSTLACRTLATAGPGLMLDESRDVFLGHALLRCNPGWKRRNQPIGSCVGYAWAMGVDVLAACDVVLRNEPESYGGDVFPASVYGFSRVEVRGGPNHGGDGSFGGAAAKAVTKYGTLHFGQDYGGTVFNETSAEIERTWGRTGVPDKLEPFAAEHKVATVTLCVSFEQAATAIQNGYPVAVCSMQGFKMSMDKGSLTPSGRWAHAMLFCGVRWKPRPQLYLANSWGNCYSGTVDETLPVPFQKSGGWVDASVCTSMLRGEDSFALAGFDGFKPRTLPDWLGGIL
jgi:hypothetical protein